MSDVQIVTDRYKGRLFIKQNDNVFIVTILIYLAV